MNIGPDCFYSSTTKRDLNTVENQTLKYTLLALVNSQVFEGTTFESISFSILFELDEVDDITSDELNFECQSTIPELLL